MIPVLRQADELGALRNAHRCPGLRDGLEEPDQELAGVLADVGPLVRTAQDRQVGRQGLDRLGDQVEVLGRVERDRHAGSPAELAGPHPGAVHDRLSGDVSAARPDPADPSIHAVHGRHARALEDPRTPTAGGRGDGLREICRVDDRVVGEVRGPGDSRGIHQGPRALGLGWPDRVHLDAERVRHGDRSSDLLPARLRARHEDRSRPAVAGPEAGQRLDLGDQLVVVRAEHRRGARRLHLHHQPGRVPGRPGGQLRTLQEHDITPAPLREVVRDRCAEDPAADHDGLGMSRNRVGHHPAVLSVRASEVGRSRPAPQAQCGS